MNKRHNSLIKRTYCIAFTISQNKKNCQIDNTQMSSQQHYMGALKILITYETCIKVSKIELFMKL